MAKKSSIDKKIKPIVKESIVLSTKKQYTEAIRKLREVLSIIRDKVKEPEEQKEELEKIKERINSTYLLEIEDIIKKTEELVNQKKFNNAIEEYNKASTITINISDPHLSETQANRIEKLKTLTEVKILLEEAIKSCSEKHYEIALKTLERALQKASNFCDQIDKNIVIIKTITNKIRSAQISTINQKSDELLNQGKYEEALNNFNEALENANLMYDDDLKITVINKAKDNINRSYSSIIDSLIKKRENLLKENKLEDAASQLKTMIEILDKMHDSNFKTKKREELSELINPSYIESIKKLMEEGEKIKTQEDFVDSIQDITKALSKFQEALKIANKMIKSEIKDRKIKEISNIINETCTLTIAPRKKTGIELIKEKKYEEAIRELYSVMSIGKNMIFSEGQENEEIEDIKRTINKVYEAEVEGVLSIGENLVIEKKHDKALETLNEALNITNKMYLSEEMDAIVNKIKNVIYETELKQIVQKGDVSEKEVKFLKEIESLQESLQVASSMKDEDLKAEEMERLRREIDLVHGNRIKLLIEQGIELTEKNQFESAFERFEKAIEITDSIELREIKNRELSSSIESYKLALNNKARRDLKNQKFDDAIASCNKANELEENAESCYIMGNAYKYKEEHDRAIQNYERAIQLDQNHANAWNEKGLVLEMKSEYQKAIDSFQNALNIDSKHASAWYNMGNAYKYVNALDKAIDSYNKAIEIDPSFSKAWFFKGSAYFGKKDYYNTIESLSKAIEINPELGKNIGNLLQDLKRIFASIGDQFNEALDKK
ncbi:MAG: tetratricopeptide repeat protein [Candidatus Lokiarchaeota archaeon]|nr:tetratricopeptide repeat protein [Candidatus Lokiarchaeota archaeon]